jgi:hypothetical protein
MDNSSLHRTSASLLARLGGPTPDQQAWSQFGVRPANCVPGRTPKQSKLLVFPRLVTRPAGAVRMAATR